MFRKLIVTAALATATLTGLSAATAASPADFRQDGRFERRDRFDSFEVQILHRGHWDTVRTFRDRDDAERSARQLRHRGLSVRIERDDCR